MGVTSKNNSNDRISATTLRKYFLLHLDRIYCAKSHLVERLPEIYQLASFRDIQLSIGETIADIEKQLIRLDEIYGLLDAQKSFADCENLIAFAESAFDAIHAHRDDSVILDLSILFYMHNIESIEESSFQILTLAANDFNSRPIKQLLKECYDEAREDKAMFLTIHQSYLSKPPNSGL